MTKWNRATSGLALGALLASCAGGDSTSMNGIAAGPPGSGLGVAGSSAAPGSAQFGGASGVGAPSKSTNTGAGAAGRAPVVPSPGTAAVGAMAMAGRAAVMPGQMPSGAGPTTTGAAGMSAGGSLAPSPPAPGGTTPTMLPTVKGMCPMLATGPITVNGVGLQAWVGAGGGGPMIIYWHGTGGFAASAISELTPQAVSDTMGAGGLIVSMESGQMGNPIDWGVYTLGDYDIVDQVVACAIEQLHIDTKRIYTSGASAGGLAAGTLAYARSGYIAGSFPNSGGVAPWPGLNVFQDPTHIPAVFTMHGAKGVDMVVIDFGDSSIALDNDVVAKGGFAVDCNHGGGHVAAPPDLLAAAWTFMRAHPFGTKPSPYAGGLPAGFPSYCMIVGK